MKGKRNKRRETKPSSRPVDPVVLDRTRGAFIPGDDFTQPVTGKHSRGRPQNPRGPPDLPVEQWAMSIRRFCVAHGFSIDSYFRMQREGWGPATMKVGSRTLISIEAAAAWRRQREAAAQEQRREREQAEAAETRAT